MYGQIIQSVKEMKKLNKFLLIKLLKDIINSFKIMT